MAYPGSQTNAEFGAGINHLANPGRANVGSLTLGTDASTADQGLGQTSQHWAAMTPYGVLASATGAGLDYAGVQRMAGSYAPGSMGQLSDELSGGADSYSSGEE